jgi:4'-phosphopantetheinyl transferase
MNSVANWRHAPDSLLRLPEGTVHIWRASLDVPAASVVRLNTLLNSEESQRADRFVQERDRHHFIVCRAVLRLLLGRYLERSSSTVHLQTQQFGKTVLAIDDLGIPLHFNLSHSHGLAIYAFCFGHELGVDLERLRPEIATEEIANRFFSIRERQELASLPRSARVAGFFNAWTRKESYVKAHGKGLQIPLDSFDVTLAPGQPVILRSLDSDCWRIYSFTPVENFTAALTVGAGEWKLDFYEAESFLK